LTGAFAIVFTSLPSGVTLTNAAGTVQGVADVANGPFIYADLSGVALEPGQSATVAVQFSDPSNATIHFTPVIY
jgi:hypothetical protein